jgi:regulator of nucleoside diphosphate kinase
MRVVDRHHVGERPPIVLTALDRDKLLALLNDASMTSDTASVRFLREEIARADIAPRDVAPNSVVRMGCEVKFVDHSDAHIRRAQLVFPEEAQNNRDISILSPVGTALIGLGVGQSIRWIEGGQERSLAVLEVRPGTRCSRDLARSAQDTLV